MYGQWDRCVCLLSTISNGCLVGLFLNWVMEIVIEEGLSVTCLRYSDISPEF